MKNEKYSLQLYNSSLKISFVIEIITDVSQPSLGGEIDQGGPCSGTGEKLETPPLSPLYSVNGTSHVSVSTKAGKIHALYHQKSLGSIERYSSSSSKPPVADRKLPDSRLFCSLG